MPPMNDKKYQAAIQQMQEALTVFLQDVILEEFSLADVALTNDMMASKTPMPCVKKLMEALKETKDLSPGVLLCCFVAVFRAELSVLSANKSNWKKT